MNAKIRWPIYFAGGFFLLLDRLFKFAALNLWIEPRMIKNFFGWLPSLNSGLVFGLPAPNMTVAAISLPLIFLVGWFFLRAGGGGRNNLADSPRRSFSEGGRFGLFLIFLGALSNFYDRLANGGVTDYFIFWISMFNLADAMIICGALISAYFYYSRCVIPAKAGIQETNNGFPPSRE